MILSQITGPAVEPVTLTEAKAHLRLEVTTDDTYVTSLITAAREYAEKVTWRCFVNTTLQLTLSGFPAPNVYWPYPTYTEMAAGYGSLNAWMHRRDRQKYETIILPKGNLQSVAWVKYYDSNYVLQTCPTSVYDVDNQSICGAIRLGYNQTWPTTVLPPRWNAVQIQYTVGYGVDASFVPLSVKQAILLLISQMYEQRVPDVTGTVISHIGFSFDALLAPHRLRRF